jgi:hypothetical protein
MDMVMVMDMDWVHCMVDGFGFGLGKSWRAIYTVSFLFLSGFSWFWVVSFPKFLIIVLYSCSSLRSRLRWSRKRRKEVLLSR